MGKLYGVGVGAGDPQLMTVKAVKILESCGVIAVPRTKGENTLALSIAQQAADLTGKLIIYLDFPMTRDKKLLDENYDSIAQLLCNELAENDVAVPVLGDISVYSTFSYIGARVEKMGFETEICPGVTSFSAAAAKLKLPLCLGNEPFHVIPFGCEDFEAQLDICGTKVIMKTGSRYMELAEILRRKGLSKCTAIVENCGLPNERIYHSIDEIKDELSYFTVFIVYDKEKRHEA
ncbi:MAG: precorrin-2 C(20)-methyltransferase [Ruminococcus sp.]|uniref:precorrin-2 C(20)-methyltransferase n=1 Tax=Ruminococcus sp. TaxID=41978 RepID=UPI0025EF8B7E|nr:precorrin-2 C(20)-methyltransferase [Ruminococcus sp.]MCR4796566.1 precorrin-2 C(20)-methyltransferase [Ruminococcus sp.]